jgi:hypothetical protein
MIGVGLVRTCRDGVVGNHAVADVRRGQQTVEWIGQLRRTARLPLRAARLLSLASEGAKVPLSQLVCTASGRIPSAENYEGVAVEPSAVSAIASILRLKI